MANLWANPWYFTAADQAATAAVTSIVRNGFRSALVTTTAANTFTLNQGVSIQGQTAALFPWNGGYRIEEIVSTTQFIIGIRDFQSTLGNVGATGNVFSTAYYGNLVYIEQLLWDVAGTGTGPFSLLITDVTGNPIWNPSFTIVSSMAYTYAKLREVNGFVLNTIPAGSVVQVTVH